MNATALSNTYGVSGLATAQGLEDELNSKVFNPLGATIEFAGPTSGPPAFDDLKFNEMNYSRALAGTAKSKFLFLTRTIQ